MANIRKQFNFRNGVQVDDDNLVVSPTGLVGIGTTIPTELLDVRGDVKVSGALTATTLRGQNLVISGNAEIDSLSLSQTIVGSGVSVGSGIVTASDPTGVVTYYGDGGRLLNLPTSQWLDIDVGLGFTSIYNIGYVGVSTNDPRFSLQIGGSNDPNNLVHGVGIHSSGDILATGIVTATKFIGIGSDLTLLNASNISSGTITNDRLPVLLNSKMPADISVSGIITASSGFSGNVTGDLTGNVTGDVTGNVVGNVTGDVTGTASTALSLNGTPNIVVGLVTSTDISARNITALGIALTTVGTRDVNATGIVTASEFNLGIGGTIVNITSDGRVGIGSTLPTRPFEIITSGTSEIELVGSEARIILAEEKSGVGIADSAGVIRYGNSDDTFELLNYTPGNFNFYLHAGGPGINTGRFGWVYGQDFNELLSLTYDGLLGVGVTNPEHNLHVVGTSTVTGNSNVGGNLSVDGDLQVTGNINGTVGLPDIFAGNVYSNTGFSTFSNVIVSSGSSLGIGTETPISGLDGRDQTALFANVGVATNIVSDNVTAHIVGNALITNGVAIGKTNYNPSAGYIQIEVPLTELNDGHINLNSNSTVGFNTSDPAAVFDFGNVGAATTRPVMIVPNIDNSAVNGIGQTPSGSVIFNTDTLKFQGYTGSAWVDFH